MFTNRIPVAELRRPRVTQLELRNFARIARITLQKLRNSMSTRGGKQVTKDSPTPAPTAEKTPKESTEAADDESVA